MLCCANLFLSIQYMSVGYLSLFKRICILRAVMWKSSMEFILFGYSIKVPPNLTSQNAACSLAWGEQLDKWIKFLFFQCISCRYVLAEEFLRWRCQVCLRSCSGQGAWTVLQKATCSIRMSFILYFFKCSLRLSLALENEMTFEDGSVGCLLEKAV